MYVSLSRRSFRRFVNLGFVVIAFLVTQAALVCSTHAENPCSFTYPQDTCSYTVDATIASESIESEYIEELCGWGTHDSGPIRSRTSASFESSIASVAATACASAGISLEQIAEPFAMVGPYESNSMESIVKLQQWWESVVETAISQGVTLKDTYEVQDAAKESEAEIAKIEPEALTEFADTEEIDTFEQEITRELDAIALEEPVDIEGAGSAACLVGSAPMIVTIEESYFSYDLAARDIRALNLFPLAKRPFCIRSRVERDDAHRMWTAVEDQIASQSDQDVTDVIIEVQEKACHTADVYCGSADCLLDEWIWIASEALQPGARLRNRMHPVTIGQQLAAIASTGNRVVSGAAGLLASVWPQTEPKPKQTAGQALLVRAEAVEADEPDGLVADAAEAQIAEAVPSNSLR